ncbi:MAG: GatB/YqeY domain-containing protein [Dehalococcoidia bacterium]|nr:GatB/YqeY domain-containing protein [Dehalococcoidia bacterium]
MTMKSRLVDDMKQAMRDKDALRRDTIRYLRSEIRNQEIRDQKELDDAGVIQVLSRQVQQRKDSIEVYRDAGRSDLVNKEESELSVIVAYLPQQLSGAEITDLVRQVVADVGATGPGDMGKVMGAIMPQVRGKAEGREVNAIVQQTLRNL